MSEVKVSKLKMKNKTDEVEITMGDDVILINRCDLQSFAEITWYVSQGRGQTKYLRANVRNPDGSKTTTEFHRYILGKESGLEIDHINRNGLDNRRCNLRFVSHRENMMNVKKRRGSSSKFFGVYRDVHRKNPTFVANVIFNGKTKAIGRFRDEFSAAVAYNNFVIENGLKARLNDV